MSDLTSANKTMDNLLTEVIWFGMVRNFNYYYALYDILLKKGVKLPPKNEWIKHSMITRRKRGGSKVSYINPLREFRKFWLYVESNVYPKMLDICECCGTILGVIEQ
jgi:hypothetical protein